MKFCISHPAVTVVTPATSNPKNMLDNLGGGIGRVPTADHRKRMVELLENLPQARPAPALRSCRECDTDRHTLAFARLGTDGA